MAYLDAEQKPFPPERCDALEARCEALEKQCGDLEGQVLALQLWLGAVLRELPADKRRALSSHSFAVKHSSEGFARTMRALSGSLK